MKKVSCLLIILSIVFGSCTKDETCTRTETQKTLLEDASVVAKGNLSSSKTNSGTATIYLQGNKDYLLGLENMNINVNNSLVIYLSSRETLSPSSIKIFSAKNLNGDIIHQLPDAIDFSLFKYLLILAERSEEVIASAELK